VSKVEYVRLQKFLADAGVASRRHAERMIERGEVSVNGRPVTKLGTKVEPERDSVKVSGKLVRARDAKIYAVLNKPAGFVTSMKGSDGAPSVASLLPPGMGRLFPIGRLDLNSEGLLLMTNDGDFAQSISHPSGRVLKRYEVKVRGSVTEEKLASMKRGIFSDGERLAPSGIRLVKNLAGGAWLEFRLGEGRNREIRRMCEAVSLRVVKLRRVAIGRLELCGLGSGEWRTISRREAEQALS
jgi:23S rRNA pseudouridine2605 synthase